VSQSASIDVSDLPDLKRVAEEVRDRQEPIVLRSGDAEIAVVTPIRPPKGHPDWKPTQEEIDAALSAFGGWKGLIDPEEFKARVREGRGSNRPPLNL
jgi:hypothetical protein